MDETTQTAEAVVETGNPVEVPERNWSKVKDLFPADTPEVPVAVTPPVAPPVETPSTTPPPSPDDDLKGIDALIAAEQGKVAPQQAAPTPAAPLTAELAQVQEWAKNPQAAQQAVQAATVFHILDDSMRRGDVETALSMFDGKGQESIKEHLYSKYKEEFVQRFIAEKEGTAVQRPDPEVATLKTKLSQMEAKLTKRERDEQAAHETRSKEASQQQFRIFLDSAFKTLPGTLTDTDKRRLYGATMAAINEDPAALREWRQGSRLPFLTKLREEFKEVNALKVAASRATEAARTQQEQHKIGQLTASAPVSTTSAPTDESPGMDDDGERKPGFWSAGLKRLGLAKE